MDIQTLTASQLAYVIRLSVFMDNHQTQGNFTSCCFRFRTNQIRLNSMTSELWRLVYKQLWSKT